jgi:transposase-like protein
MGRGRPPKGLSHVDSLAGSEADRERLKVVLSTLTGERSVKGASRILGISPARFHELRRQALEGALSAVSPGRPGRPRREEDPSAAEVARLEAQVKWLEEELQCSLTRTEIALSMPHLLKGARVRGAEKRGSSPKGRRRGSTGGSSGT